MNALVKYVNATDNYWKIIESGKRLTPKRKRTYDKWLSIAINLRQRVNRPQKQRGQWTAAQYRKNEVSHHATWISRYQSHDDSEYLTGSMDIHGKDILK